MLNKILIFICCQILPDSEHEFERELTNLSDLSNDLAEEYPHYQPEHYSPTWRHFIFNNT